MFTVALIGPDGAGKTTIARRLEDSLPMPAKYLYMGVNAEASNRLLPTTRAMRALRRTRGVRIDSGPPPAPGTPASAAGGLRRSFRRPRAVFRLVNQLAEEAYRQLLAWRYVRRGSVVLFDRHFFADYHAYDVVAPGRPLTRRIHGFVLSRLLPRPDLVVYLDADPEVLRSRKGEGSLDALRRRRRDYLRLAGELENFTIVDASRPVDEVAAEVAELIQAFDARARRDEGAR